MEVNQKLIHAVCKLHMIPCGTKRNTDIQMQLKFAIHVVSCWYICSSCCSELHCTSAQPNPSYHTL